MLAYALSRIGRAAITLLLIVTAAFVILRLTGDPAIIILGPDAPPAAHTTRPITIANRHHMFTTDIHAPATSKEVDLHHRTV